MSGGRTGPLLALGWSWKEIHDMASCKHRTFTTPEVLSELGFPHLLYPGFPADQSDRAALLPKRGHALAQYLYG